jgi:hypothetical protein
MQRYGLFTIQKLQIEMNELLKIYLTDFIHELDKETLRLLSKKAYINSKRITKKGIKALFNEGLIKIESKINNN